MKKMIVIALSALLGTSSAMAIEVGVIGGYQSVSVTTTDSVPSYSSSSATDIGALLLFSIFPFVQVRTGVISKSRDIKVTALGVNGDIKDSILDIPINLQVGLPLGLYVFGGVIYSSTQSTSCTSGLGSGCFSSSKTPDDMPINLGVGFNLLDIALFKLGIEAEYQMGTKNLDTQGSGTTKANSFGGNLVAKVGF